MLHQQQQMPPLQHHTQQQPQQPHPQVHPQQQQHPQHQQPHHPVPDQLGDNVSKAKSLYRPLQEALNDTIRAAGININSNMSVEQGVKNAGDVNQLKFEENLEKFYFICDEIEMNLKTAIDNFTQNHTACIHTPTPVVANDSQYHAVLSKAVNSQVKYVLDVHTCLTEACHPSATPSATRPPTEPMATMETTS